MCAAANNRGVLFVWRFTNDAKEQLRLVQKKQAHKSYILKCLLSPDARLLATTSADKTIKIFDVQNDYALSKTLNGHSGWVWDCAFSADSEYLISGSSDKTAKLWAVAPEQAQAARVLDYSGHSKAVTAVALNDVTL
jgi:G protein beta subunit-like protein